MKKHPLGRVILIVLVTLSLHSNRLWAADEIKLGVLSTAGDHWPRWVAWDQGFFKEQNSRSASFKPIPSPKRFRLCPPTRRICSFQQIPKESSSRCRRAPPSKSSRVISPRRSTISSPARSTRRSKISKAARWA